jgi:cytochrome P450
MTVHYEPFASSCRDDPYPTYRLLRDEDPVHRSQEHGVWCISRYDDVLAVLKDTGRFSSEAMFTVLMSGGKIEPPRMNLKLLRFVFRYAWRLRLNALKIASSRNLIASDPPVHGPLRNLVNRGFTPRVIRGLEPRIREIVSRCLEKLDRDEDFDVVQDLAIPLPVTLISEMIGIEPERSDEFKRWSDDLIEGTTGGGADPFEDPKLTTSVIELHSYLKGIIRQRRREPRDDLISAVLAKEPGGSALTELEVLNFLQLLILAGNETTTNLIGNAVHALLENSDQLARVAEDASLLPGMIEEALRYDSPIQQVFRTVTVDTEVAGTRVAAGDTLVLMLGSANRDERRFPDPDRFDVTRDASGHLGFGFGAHFCLGASLARLEATVALEGLVPELPGMKRAGGRRELIDSFLVRGTAHLPLRREAA